MDLAVADRIYPERRFGGFTQWDGTIQFCSRVRALLRDNSSVLDVGCGRGRRQEDACAYRRELQRFQGASRNVIGIDVDPAAATNPYIDEFRPITDTRRWPVDAESVDLIYSDYVLEHVDDPSAFFTECHRVLKPGGHIALRTPNAHGYIALVSRLVPQRHHARVTKHAQQGRKEIDVFPTLYRCNTRRQILRELTRQGFEACVYAYESEPCYMEFSAVAYRLAAMIHPWFPPLLRSTLLAFARKSISPRTTRE